MAKRVYPSGNVPVEWTRMVGEIKGTIMRMHDLRASGLRDQRKLEQRAADAKEGRQRLGRAMAALGEDLSKTRVTLRDAENHVRPWLQAFSIGAPKYGPQQNEEQKRAVYDSGSDGWVMWETGSRY